MDYDLIAILSVMGMIVLCIAPDIKEILLIISLCINVLSLTKGLESVHKKRNKETVTKEKMTDVHFYPQSVVESPYPPMGNPFDAYQGKVDYEESPPVEYGAANDKIARLNIERQGTDYVRQIKGEMGRMKAIKPYVENDCSTDEFKDWWSRYDY
jgi:hypothetical protein